ncbi:MULTISPECIES: DUF4084 domain-containing protein [Saccharibacillus]|uniref:DUF4084 domain-containing protein n=1 Tax=Saccharibacillus TaxID=456492 RepID=UPI0012397425|nr:DUF4084 domain-containing protein [Saccharibacillus sp. WB 17]MWJ31894.1 DUF4084 domain-containing protein [Saccharibacillus sp. WB 17]
MTDRNKNIALCTFTVLFTLTYYLWITIWQNNPDLSGFGGSVFAGLGNLIAIYWLLGAARRSSRERRIFWILLMLGSVSYLIAEAIWLYDEVVLGIAAPSPGWTDVFYALQTICYLAAFIYPFTRFERSHRVFKLLFDVLIVMTVATTFSWHFLIGPLLRSGDADILHLAISLAYPVGDLVLLFGAISLYWGARQFLADRLILLVFGGLVVHAAANSFYLYLVSVGDYAMGSLVDPVFTLSLLLIGGAGVLQSGGQPAKFDVQEDDGGKKLDLLRLALPYLNVIALFVFMISGSGKVSALTIGSGISILLVIVRQLFILLENRRLLLSLYDKTEELEISKQRYKSLFDYHPDAVYSLDLSGRFDSANEACSDMLGYDSGELIGLTPSSFLKEQELAELSDDLKRLCQGESVRQQIRVRSRSGQLHEVSVTSIPIRVRDKIVGIFGIGRDITANKKNEARIRHLAYHDPLTDLANRASFEETLRSAVQEAPDRQERMAVAFIDLDRFKTVNDTLGHDVGDQLLIAVSQRLQSCMRAGDTVARQGGDEFTLLLRDIDGPEDVHACARRILDALSLPYDLDGRQVTSLPSIGLSLYPADDTTTVGLMKKADIALYQVKDGGKGHYRLFGDCMPEALDRLSLESDLAAALKQGELLLHYQPQLDPDTGALEGAEAQLRWNRPGFGLLEPEAFMPAAEEAGLSLRIGEWMLREAGRQARAWSDEGAPLRITVGLSRQQLEQADLADRLRLLLAETGADPRLLELQLAEASLASRPELVVRQIQAFKALGLPVSVAGCGAGYAALAGLADFPVDRLKLDPGLTRQIGSVRLAQSVAASFAGLARALHVHAAAAGVENAEQAALLRGMARFGLQGPLFGHALPPGELRRRPLFAPEA